MSVPGTCGELVQGWQPDWDVPVLVSCPIGVHSRVRVTLRPDARLVAPRRLVKLHRAAQLAREYLEQPAAGATFAVTSQLSWGRGMASSTADIVGAMAGLAGLLNQPLSPAELARLACRIEPSDSTMFAELTALAYRNGGRFEPLGTVPNLPLLLLDPGQVVDTLKFNRGLNLSALRKLGPTTLEALHLLRLGALAGDAQVIGAASSLSAVSYQSIFFNPLLSRAQQWAGATGATGVVRAHSGSIVGLLYPSGTLLTEPARWLKTRFDGVVTATRLVPGGAQRELSPQRTPENGVVQLDEKLSTCAIEFGIDKKPITNDANRRIARMKQGEI